MIKFKDEGEMKLWEYVYDVLEGDMWYFARHELSKDDLDIIEDDIKKHYLEDDGTFNPKYLEHYFADYYKDETMELLGYEVDKTEGIIYEEWF